MYNKNTSAGFNAQKRGDGIQAIPLSGRPSRTQSSWPNRASIFRLILRPPDWTKAVVNAKKIPASLAGIFPPSLRPSLREAEI
jgi:hypothetical protein